jgi:hypothetical protein
MRSRGRLLSACVAIVAGATLLLAAAGPAGADPINPPGREAVTIHCDALGDLEVIVEGNGEWTHTALAMHVLDSNLMLLAYKYHYEVTPQDGQTFVVEGEKPAPQGGRLDVCRFSQTFPGQGTIYTILGVSYTRA